MSEAKSLIEQYQSFLSSLELSKKALYDHFHPMLLRLQERFSEVHLECGGVYPDSFDIIVVYDYWNTVQIPWSTLEGDLESSVIKVGKLIEKRVEEFKENARLREELGEE